MPSIKGTNVLSNYKWKLEKTPLTILGRKLKNCVKKNANKKRDQPTKKVGVQTKDVGGSKNFTVVKRKKVTVPKGDWFTIEVLPITEKEKANSSKAKKASR